MSDLERMKSLAALVKQKNDADREIAEVIGRPALQGHFGEYVAAGVFGVALHDSAAQKGSDGRFSDGPLAGKTVEIKYYPKNEGLLDMKTGDQPDFYLALTGPRKEPAASRGATRPWVIESAYLFDAPALVAKLTAKIGTATSVRQELWREAEIYPRSNPAFPLTEDQRDALELFSEAAVG